MRKLALLFLLLPFLAHSQSIPNGTIVQGESWTASQWNAAWQAKADVLNGVLTNPTFIGGSFGTPTSLLLTYATGLPASSLVGTLPSANFPALTGDCTTSSGSTVLNCTATNGVAFGSLATASTVNLATQVTGIAQQANGGTGTATPGFIQGAGIQLTGTWPNYTITTTATVNSGTGGQVAYYPSNGTTLSGLATTGGGNAVLSNSPLIIQAVDVNPTNSGTVNVANMAAHITACVAAGGCTISLGAYSTPIPMANSTAPAIILGVSATTGTTGVDTPYSGVIIRGAGYTINPVTFRAITGTVLQGTSTAYPLIAYNNVDNTVDYSSYTTLANSQLVGFGLYDVALDTASYCIKIGAKSKSGIFYSNIRNVTCSNWTQWAYYLENWQNSDVQDLNAQDAATGAVGTTYLGASFGSLLYPGNSTFRRVFGAPGNSPGIRGTVIQARPSAGGVGTQLNDINFYDIQQNTNPYTASQTATFTNSSANIAVTNLAAWPVDLPVTFTGNAGGSFYAGVTYFVISNGGTTTPNYAGTGAGNIQLSTTQGGASGISAGSSGTGTIETGGWPALEVVGYGSNASVTSLKLDGADLEASGTTDLVIQSTFGDFEINNFQPGIASTVKMTNSWVQLDSKQAIVIDSDQNSSVRSTFNVPYSAIGTSFSAIAPSSYVPAGPCLDIAKNTSGINIGGSLYPNNGYFACDVASSNYGSAHYWQANVAIGQKSIYNSFGSSPGQADASSAGVDVYKTTAGSVAFNLATASTTNSTYGGSGQAANTSTGMPNEIFNDGTNLFTMTAASGQYFDNVTGLGTIELPPGAAASIRYEGDNSVGFPLVEYLSTNATIDAPPVVSGCGTAGSLVGSISAGGYAGSFTVGTGASPCTFVITIPLAAKHGWMPNADDVTGTPVHLPSAAAASTTSISVKGNATTGDTIQFSAIPY